MEHPVLAIILPSVYGTIFLIFILYGCIVYLTKGQAAEAQGQPPAEGNAAQPGEPPVEGNVAQPGEPPVEGNVAQPGQPPVEGNAAQPGQPPVEGNVAQPGQHPVEGNAAQPGQPPVAGNAGNAGNPQHEQPEIVLSRATVFFNLFQGIFIMPSIMFIPPVSRVIKSDTFYLLIIPFMMLDALFLLIIWKQKTNITPKLVAFIEIGYVREIMELFLWGLGLYLQNIIDPECIICLFTLLNCSYFLVSFVLFLRHPRALSFLDFAIGINAVILVYFIKLIDSGRKLKGYEYGLFSLSITTCVSVLLFKSHQESVIGGIENPRTIFSILGIYIFTPIRRLLEYCWNKGILLRNWVKINYPVAKNWMQIKLNAAQNWVCNVVPNWFCNFLPNWCCNVVPNWLKFYFNVARTWVVNACFVPCLGDGAEAV